MQMTRFLCFLSLCLAALAVACGAADAKPERQARVVFVDQPVETRVAVPAPTPSPSPLPTPRPTPAPQPTAEPTARPTPVPTARPTPQPTAPPIEVRAGAALVMGDGVLVRSAPTTQGGEVVRRLRNLDQINVLGAVNGEQWVVGEQDWPMVPHAWTRTWYQVEGGYVYSAHIFVPRPGESTPFLRSSAERTLEVSLSSQRLKVMVGEEVVYQARVTTGKVGYETPTGTYRLYPGGRVFNETMTSGQAAISDPAEAYNVKNVLYTQYFTSLGDALHLNYWQPESVFGAQPTSHGCVGLMLHDAQWLWLFVQSGTTLVIRA